MNDPHYFHGSDEAPTVCAKCGKAREGHGVQRGQDVAQTVDYPPDILHDVGRLAPPRHAVVAEILAEAARPMPVVRTDLFGDLKVNVGSEPEVNVERILGDYDFESAELKVADMVEPEVMEVPGDPESWAAPVPTLLGVAEADVDTAVIAELRQELDKAAVEEVRLVKLLDEADAYAAELFRTISQLQAAAPDQQDLVSAGDPRFHALLKHIGDLHDKKQRDYGTEGDPLANIRGSRDWGVAPWVGALVRLSDKVHRLQRFAQRGSLANESAEDSMQDIAVYALLALILYREEAEAGQ